jgi:hypothetical protein
VNKPITNNTQAIRARYSAGPNLKAMDWRKGVIIFGNFNAIRGAG